MICRSRPQPILCNIYKYKRFIANRHIAQRRDARIIFDDDEIFFENDDEYFYDDEK